MCLKFAALTLAYLSGLTAAQKVRQDRQVGSGYIDKEDNVPAESVYGGNPYAGNKFFQDIYMAMEQPGQLEFGHVAETPKYWEQRFEKLNLDNLHRQGKVRWGDKNGGYGEHYFDYNHGGAEDPGSEHYKPEYAILASQYAEDESQDVPAGIEGGHYHRHRGKRQIHRDVEFINDRARSLILEGGTMQKHGGNYRKAKDDFFRYKRQPENAFGGNLAYDSKSGLVVDQNTGHTFYLLPADQTASKN
ncbi:unnamed protein product [Acanthoscelides obtectus]|uniref:Uncharacterized protein n=1 Tax=Acanthoscelides obtectus TaxID=200917 RepID=A0A9P0L0H7_ACAOB|nr:unnamed protein product [Acanthoscelides obtectus]CAK1649565.1 hypothetical protein AOBTE_LOCUS16312 [Acanthoscelides obtectus]